MIEEIKEIFVETLELDPKLVNENFTPDDAPSWDSLNNLRLITAFEEEFDIQFSMDEIKSMVSFGEIIEVIKKHLQK